MDMDVPDQAPIDGLYPRKASGKRRLSYASQTSGNVRMASTTGTLSRAGQLRGHASTLTVRSHAGSETDQTEIHSPVPTRHFLLQTESHQWLTSGTLSGSPASSRPTSPVSAVSTSFPHDGFSSTSPRLGRRQPALSFSSLHEYGNSTSKDRKLPSASGSLRRKDDDRGEDGVDAGMGRRWIRWMHRNRMREGVLPCSIGAALWIKWCVGLGGYSGAGTPPMYGDYEAQRHWMEITNHLPIRQWYTYDLQYWGLDYPPLTAYHSWLCGLIGSFINPSWFELDKSRGIETPESKQFVRATVLVSDALVYIPALVFFVRALHANRSKRTQSLALLSLLLQPSLILIDSGHFQFNSVMLGFTLLALNFFSQGRDELGAICFVASLGFKQMALYYAPAIGSYLLGRCISLGPKAGSRLFLRLAITTILSFILLFLPFLPPFAPLTGILDPIIRIFPFNRGLFEDKVANFWCASNVVFRWRSWLPQPALVKLSAVLTVLGFLPSAAQLVFAGWKTMDISNGADVPKASSQKKDVVVSVPTLPILPWALLSSSMSFFLFSFQVHEKSILLPLLPLNLLLSGSPHDSFMFNWGVLTNNVAIFSMWPLLKKDGLAIPYIATTFLWNYMLGYNPFRKMTHRRLLRYISLIIYSAMFLLHITELLFSPPRRYPDLFPVLNVLISTPVFVLTWLWSIKRGTEVTWGVVGLSLRPKSSKRS
ncbi:glucosyltransferase [Sanghuangporus baumii]|uniref:Alpha-1,3-glucosyltransferase n=1 Tax=Sanghuangporus baumii TaxID=108892 RepID=A0A9Q5I255_SANBA|nr:glucosyltransferase [Sanghuangporus baumii]